MRTRIDRPEDLGRAIRTARAARGLTLAEVALAAGTGMRFVSELERGKATAEIGRTLRVLQAIGMRAWVED